MDRRQHCEMEWIGRESWKTSGESYLSLQRLDEETWASRRSPSDYTGEDRCSGYATCVSETSISLFVPYHSPSTNLNLCNYSIECPTAISFDYYSVWHPLRCLDRQSLFVPEDIATPLVIRRAEPPQPMVANGNTTLDHHLQGRMLVLQTEQSRATVPILGLIWKRVTQE